MLNAEYKAAYVNIEENEIFVSTVQNENLGFIG